MKKHLLFIVLFVFSLSSFGQNNCKDALYNANTLFETGKIQACIDKLEPCVASIKPKESKFEGYKLLAIAYQELGNTEKMDKYIGLMLQSKPYYNLYPNGDPASFSKAINNFIVTPNFYFGIKAGISINDVKLIESFSALQAVQAYNPQLGYQFGAELNKNLLRNIEIGAAITYGGTRINHEITSFQNWDKVYMEKLNFLSLGLNGKKFIPVSDKLKLFGGLNVSLSNLTQSKVTVLTTNYISGNYAIESKEALTEKNKIQPNFGFNAGLSYELSRGRVMFDFGYQLFSNTTFNEAKRLEDIDFIFDTQYINDDIKMKFFTFNISYSIPLNYYISKK
jgi:hypothetical protein